MNWRPDIRKWVRRLLDTPRPRFARRAPPRPGLSQNHPELALLERQAKAAEANVRATIALTGTLLLVAFLQWRTSESTAAIERAKAIPRFRVDQIADTTVDNGFLAKSLTVVATSGVSATTEASVRQIFLIHYASSALGLQGICRASISGFYGFGANFLEWSETEAAEDLLLLGNATGDPRIRLQPIATIIAVTYYDLYGRPGRENLKFAEGVAVPIKGDPTKVAGWSNIDLLIRREGDGPIVIFRQNAGTTSQDCADALRVMQQFPSLAIAKTYYFGDQRSFYVYKNPGAFFSNAENHLITPTNPIPRHLAEADPRRR